MVWGELGMWLVYGCLLHVYGGVGSVAVDVDAVFVHAQVTGGSEGVTLRFVN